MVPHPLNQLHQLGQSLWLDYIDRSLLNDGTLRRLIDEDSLTGLTSNPAIFEKAIATGAAYAKDLAQLPQTATPEDIYQTLVLGDIANAAAHFLPVYERTGGLDGYVSIEVSPLLARDHRATVDNARELWARLRCPNIMIKVPGTREGLMAIPSLLIDGINVNVTLLFSVHRYTQVLETYLCALEQRQARGLPIHHIASVASFFLSRIDTKVDAQLDKMRGDTAKSPLASELRGSAAIASAALAYEHFRQVIRSSRWRSLADAGAAVQRLLWASTGTKDPAYSDIKYVEPVIAKDTINTLPLETMNAYRDHGQPALRIEQAIAKADEVMVQLNSLGIDINLVAQELEEEGIAKFVAPYQASLQSLARLDRTRELS